MCVLKYTIAVAGLVNIASQQMRQKLPEPLNEMCCLYILAV